VRVFTFFCLNAASRVLSTHRIEAATLAEAIALARSRSPARCASIELWEGPVRVHRESANEG
jgi:hypothetical protein